MQTPIVFYDIPANVKGTAWSGNTLKIRYVLNYKNLPFRTVWVEFPDIARTCASIGAGPTGSWSDGSPMYTLPAIVDPNTGGTALADSAAIARYLDATYPDRPAVFPAGTEVFHEAFQTALDALFVPHLFRLVMPCVRARLRPEARAHFKRAREDAMGGDMDAWSPMGSAVRAQQWETAEAAFGKIARWYTVGGVERRFVVGGEKLVYADLVLAARLLWMKRILGEDSDEWKRVEGWHGGRWAGLLGELDRYSM